MPMYEYHCLICGHEFEVLQRLGEGNENLECPHCQTPRPEKKFSTFAAQGRPNSVPSGCGAPDGFT